MKKKKFKKYKEDIEGLSIPAGLFIGMGIGFIADNFVVWMFIGLGVGFLLMMIIRLLKKK